MLTLFHSPKSRSSAIVALLDELGVRHRITIETVTIPRIDGSGGQDGRNPHPEGKVPYLVHDGHGISERGAIILYLTDMFPEAGLGPKIGDPMRGEYLSWLSWYQGVMEPVLIFKAAGLDHPYLHATFRDYDALVARLETALRDGRPYLLGDRYSGADHLLHTPFVWFSDYTPDVPTIRDWVARCAGRPAWLNVRKADEVAMA